MSSNEYQVSDTEGRPGPASELDLRDSLVGPQTDDEILKSNNYGTGVYTDDEYWQQVGNFEDHLYAIEGVHQYLNDAAEAVVRHKIAEYGFEYTYTDANGDAVTGSLAPWEDLSEDERAERGERPPHVAKVWDQLSEDQRDLLDPEAAWIDTRYDDLPPQGKLQAVRQFTDFEPTKSALHGRLMSGLHELSRSKGEGRLLELALGRFIRTEGEGQQAMRQHR